jgi:hypothetical protein
LLPQHQLLALIEPHSPIQGHVLWVQQRNPCLEVDIRGADGTRIVGEMVPHQLAAGCLAGCNDGLRVLGHFHAAVDLSLLSGPALAKLLLCALLVTMPLNHVNE